MSDNPDPLVPPDADLRDMPWMPLDIARLKRSKAWLACKKAPELAFYMVNLWTASWHEMPPASLEDDDEVLADAAMCDEKRWPKVREKVLRGWVKIGSRLFHPVVAEKATETWGKKEDYRRRMETVRAAKDAKRTAAPVTAPTASTAPVKGTAPRPATKTAATHAPTPVTSSVTETGTGAATALKGEVRDREREKDRESPPPPTPSDAAKSMAAAFLELREQHWPNEARLPAPRMTIEAEAEQFVTAGATPPLLREIVDRVMRQNLAKGDGPPNSLKFCRHTLERAVRQHTEAHAPASNGHTAPAPSDEEPGAWKRRAQQEEDSAINLAARGVATPRLSRAMVEKGLADGRIKPEQLASLGYGNLVRSDGAAA